MGAVIYLAADRREILPHSRIMIHDPSFGKADFSGQKSKEIEEHLAGLNKMRKTLATITAYQYIDLAEARKTETKFRENILSLMMYVLISSDKPNALLCGPAGCEKAKIVEEFAKAAEKITADIYNVKSMTAPTTGTVIFLFLPKILNRMKSLKLKSCY